MANMQVSLAALQRRVQNLEFSNEGLQRNIDRLSQEVIDLHGHAGQQSRINFILPGNDSYSDSDSEADEDHVPGATAAQVPTVTRTKEETENLIQKALHRLPADCGVIIAKLITEVSPPAAEVGKMYERGEILFPANTVNIVSKELCESDHSSSSMLIMLSTLDTIREVVANLQGEDLITGGAFWLSNAYQIYLGLLSIDREIEMGEISMRGAKRDAKAVVTSAYKRWIREVCRMCDRMFETIVEEQEISGFCDGDFSSRPGSMYKVADLINLFTRVHTIMKAFYFPKHCLVECMDEIVKVTLDKAFNSLILRNDFLSSKRAIQIINNITKVKNWCMLNDVDEGSRPVERVFQAANFILLHKQYQEDIDRLYIQCFLLLPIHFHTLLARYCLAEGEPRVSAKVMSRVSKRLKQAPQEDVLINVHSPGSGVFIGTEAKLALFVRDLQSSYFLPKKVQLPQIRELFDLLQSRVTDEPPELYTVAVYDESSETESETSSIDAGTAADVEGVIEVAGPVAALQVPQDPFEDTITPVFAEEVSEGAMLPVAAPTVAVTETVVETELRLNL